MGKTEKKKRRFLAGKKHKLSEEENIIPRVTEIIRLNACVEWKKSVAHSPMLWLLVNGSGWASACCRILYSRLHVFILSMSKYTCCSAIYLCVCESKKKSTLKKKISDRTAAPTTTEKKIKLQKLLSTMADEQETFIIAFTMYLCFLLLLLLAESCLPSFIYTDTHTRPLGRIEHFSLFTLPLFYYFSTLNFLTEYSFRWLFNNISPGLDEQQ